MFSLLIILVICTNGAIASVDTCGDVSSYVTSGIPPPGVPFWYLKVDDVGTCIRVCVRRAPCRAMTFHTTSTVCSLYTDVAGASQSMNASYYKLLYSNFTSFPENVDKDCYSRPCGEYQVCVPGRLADGDTGCSYTCMNVSEPVCPLPAALSGRRTVGSVNNVTCERGFVGGGVAVCRRNRTWSDEVTPCKHIYESVCNQSVDTCSVIQAVCSSGHCECRPGQQYNATLVLCEPIPECPVLEGYSGPRTPGSTAEVVCDTGFTGGGQTMCGPDVSWTVDVSCEPIIGHVCSNDSFCSDIHAVCTNNNCACSPGTRFNDTTWMCEDIYEIACDMLPSICSDINGECVNGQCVCPLDHVYNGTVASCVPVQECPLLEGYSGPRTEGSTATVVCDTGLTGGGSTVCGRGFNWTPDVSCAPIHSHACSDDSICYQINAACIDRLCQCPTGHNYNSTARLCEFDGDCFRFPMPEIPNSIYANVSINGADGLNFTCTDMYFPRRSGPTYTVSVCTAQGWETTQYLSCYTCGPPGDIAGAIMLWSSDQSVRQYECNSTDGLWPKPGSGNGTIQCQEPDPGAVVGTWIPQDFACYGARLVDGNSYNSGFLQMFLDGWANIGEETSFGWEDATVVCKDINPSFLHGGTFHPDYFYQVPTLERTIKFTDIACTSKEESLALCPDFERQGDTSRDNALGITCYMDDVLSGAQQSPTGKYAIYLQASPLNDPSLVDMSVMVGRAIVVYNGTVGAICRDQWSNSESDLFCQILNPNWMRKGDCSECQGFTNGDNGLAVLATSFDCQGKEPSFFLCSNQGWFYTDSCVNEVIIACTGPS